MRYIGITLLLAVLASCTRNNPPEEKLQYELVTLSYNQTQCADKWGYASGNAELAARIDTFLANRNLEASQITFRNTNEAAVCLACVCPTGKVIDINVANRQTLIDSFATVGFRP